MLHWFTKWLNELHQKDRKGEKGFIRSSHDKQPKNSGMYDPNRS